jgi:hypothetical protein
MQTAVRRPNAPKPNGGSQQNINQVQAFNKNANYIQGFRATVPSAGSIPITMTLTSPGRFLTGVSILPASGVSTDLADCQVTFVVNNHTLLSSVACNTANPNFSLGFLFLPTPQPLSGQDTMIMTIAKNTAVAVIVIANVFYEPKIQ